MAYPRRQKRAAPIGLAAATVIAILIAGCGSDGPSGLQAPDEVTAHRTDWPLANRDYANTRATFDARIDASNVAQLEIAWYTAIPGFGAFGNLSSTPLVLGDRIYVQDLNSNVYAIDFATGAVIWESQIAAYTPGPNGPAVGYGQIFVATNNTAIALDLETGAQRWSTPISSKPTEGIDIQLTVVDGKVLLSTVPVSAHGIFAAGDRGIIYALDASTGSVLWTFDTVDSPDLWGHPEINSGGGAWYPPAIDLQSGITYWGTGNPAPFPGVAGFPNGASRPGPNLYTDSVVALDAASGALHWFNQIVPHDIFDRDFPLTMLADIRSRGATRRAVIGAGKNGTVHALDAQTGSELWRTAVGQHHNDDLTELPPGEDIEVSPGLYGGVLTPPAYADGVVYASVLNMATPYRADTTNPFSFLGRLPTATSELDAIDAATGAIVWTTTFDAASFGGATVVNDLVFTSTFDGTIYALACEDGHIVWSTQAGGGINGWPAAVDDTILLPIGSSSPAELVAFRLPKP